MTAHALPPKAMLPAPRWRCCVCVRTRRWRFGIQHPASWGVNRVRHPRRKIRASRIAAAIPPAAVPLAAALVETVLAAQLIPSRCICPMERLLPLHRQLLHFPLPIFPHLRQRGKPSSAGTMMKTITRPLPTVIRSAKICPFTQRWWTTMQSRAWKHRLTPERRTQGRTLRSSSKAILPRPI